MGLIQGVLEQAGIATTSVSVCEEITSRVGPPRWLLAPYPFGYPLGRPGDRALQRRIILEALDLLRVPGPGPLSRRFVPATDTGAAPGPAPPGSPQA